jgi:hypothetical protein
MMVLDVTTGRWRYSTDGLVARAFHSATLVGSLIYIYGGTSGACLVAVCSGTRTRTRTRTRTNAPTHQRTRTRAHSRA